MANRLAFLCLDAPVPRDHLQPLFVQQREQLFGNEEKVALHQPDGNGGHDGLQDADSGCVRQCLLAAALLLLGFEAGIGLRRLLLRMVHRAGRLGANLPQFALVDAVRHDGLGGVLARFELRPLRLLRRVGLLLPDFDVLVARDGLLAFRLLLVCRADLDKLRLGGNLGLYVRVQLGGVAIRVGASIRIAADIGKEQFVVSGALGAIDAASGGGNKLRVAFVERRLFQEQEDVMLNPLLQVANREQDALGLGSGSVPLLAEAIGECLFLLRGLQFGE